jgi:hypothetical protein
VDKALLLQRQVGLPVGIEPGTGASSRAGAIPVSDTDLGLVAPGNRPKKGTPNPRRPPDQRQRRGGRSSQSSGPSSTKAGRGNRRSKRPTNPTEPDAAGWSSSRVGPSDSADKPSKGDSRSDADPQRQRRRSAGPPARGGRPGPPKGGKGTSVDPKRTSKRSGKPRPKNKGGGHGR